MSDVYPCPSCSNDDYDNMDDEAKSKQANHDADTIQQAQHIMGHSNRHATAYAALKQRASDAKQAAAKSGRHLHSKVAKGLKAAFPDKNDDTPFNKAAQSGGTPYTQASQNRKTPAGIEAQDERGDD
jgi:hypothetical protein